MGRVGVRWYLVVLAIVFVIYLPSVIVGLLNGPIPTASLVFTSLVWFIPMFLYTLLASGLEEPGWRGYALPNLQTRHNARKASLILGIIWGIWHWPIFIPVYTSVLNARGGLPL
jgi:membrane protease YdiL (CAAX protease family)